MLRKLFRPKITTSWNIIEKDAVDEIIEAGTGPSDRRVEKAMHFGARGGCR
jgi:hypothetical protein